MLELTCSHDAWALLAFPDRQTDRQTFVLCKAVLISSQWRAATQLVVFMQSLVWLTVQERPCYFSLGLGAGVSHILEGMLLFCWSLLLLASQTNPHVSQTSPVAQVGSPFALQDKLVSICPLELNTCKVFHCLFLVGFSFQCHAETRGGCSTTDWRRQIRRV